MTELEKLQKLQEQIEELKKTVDDLKSERAKVVNMKDILSEKECEIFWKYFKKQNYNDPKFTHESTSTPGLVFSYGPKISTGMDTIRRSIRDAARHIYRFNNFDELIENTYNESLFYKIIKTNEQLNEYIGIFESICKATVATVQGDFKN